MFNNSTAGSFFRSPTRQPANARAGFGEPRKILPDDDQELKLE